MDIKPKINRQFWYDMSEDMVTNAGARITEAANKLYTFVAWIQAIFTASTILSFKFNEAARWLIYLVPFPFILITIAGVLCIWTQIPVSVNFDYRVADTIESAYEENIRIRIKRLKIAQILTVVGALGTSIIIFYSFAFSDNNVKTAEKTVYLDAGYHKTTARELTVSLAGYCPPKAPIRCTVIAQDSATRKDIILDTHFFINTASGDFIRNFNTSSKTTVSDYRIALEWQDKDNKETKFGITQVAIDLGKGK